VSPWSAGGIALATVMLSGCAGPGTNERPGSAESAADSLARMWSDSAAAVLADSVVGEFRHAWEGYVAHAWGHDDLRPVSRGFRDWYDGSTLYMTPVDAFDTMLLMGLDDEAAAAKAVILDSLSFDHDAEVQVFEVTIRLLGGLLSAFQMDGDPRWLELATDLGDRLMPAFDPHTGIPWRFVHLRTGRVSDPINNPAEIGTLMLEFGTLSKLTGDARFYDAAKAAVRAVQQRRSPLGLVGTTIDARTGDWVDETSHITGRIDSWYEYLLKSWLLFDDTDFREWWRAGAAAVDEYLADDAATGLWYRRVDMNTGEMVATRFGALDAFLPAVLVLGGRAEVAEGRDGTPMFTRGTRLMDSVEEMWTRWPIEPEEFDYSTMEITSPGYELRPEALESAYYLWSFTSDERYREMGRRMFEAIVDCCRTQAGYASLADVRTGEHADLMHSFFLAETLKYAWLLFAPPDEIELRTSATGQAGAMVFNTEAHPLRRTW
jgi:mannosidase alpha-like ER degradation enhancer 2